MWIMLDEEMMSTSLQSPLRQKTVNIEGSMSSGKMSFGKKHVFYKTQDSETKENLLSTSIRSSD